MLKALKKYKAPYLFILPFFILFFVFQLVFNVRSLANGEGFEIVLWSGFCDARR